MENKDRIQDLIEEAIRENWNYDEGFEQKKYDALKASTFARFKDSDFDGSNQYDGFKREDYGSASLYFDEIFSMAFEVVAADLRESEEKI